MATPARGEAVAVEKIPNGRLWMVQFTWSFAVVTQDIVVKLPYYCR